MTMRSHQPASTVISGDREINPFIDDQTRAIEAVGKRIAERVREASRSVTITVLPCSPSRKSNRLILDSAAVRR